MRQLTAVDAQFLDLEDGRNLGHVAFVTIVDPSTAAGGTIDARDLCRVVGDRLDRLPPFRWKLAPVPFGLSRPYWVDDPDFDLDFHIRELALPPAGDDRALAEQVARISSRPLDRARPLWELYVIHGLTDGHVAILTKMHHAAVDGASGMDVMGVLFDDTPQGGTRNAVPRAAPPAGRGDPGEFELFLRGLADLSRQPLRFAQTLRRAVRDAGTWSLQPDALQRPPSPAMTRRDGDVVRWPSATPPSTRFNDRISGHRRFSFGELSLDTVKAIKRAFGVTVNDVVIALCAGALRAWLLERDELPSEPLVAMVPVSVRAPEQSGTFGNRVSAMFVEIPTDDPDPRRRVERSHEVMRAAKELHRAIPAELLQDFADFIPPAVGAQAARLAFRLADRRRPGVNCVISNVPGPQTPLYCAGARISATYPVSVITDGMGLNITLMSYCGRLDFGIVVDRDQVDEPWPLIERLRDELERCAAVTP